MRTLVIQPLPSIGDMVWHTRALKAISTRLPRPWVALGISATAIIRVWPAHRFAELAIQLLQSIGGTVFLCCALYEASLAQTIKHYIYNQSYTATIVMPQQLELTMALLSLSTCFIGNDSELLNIAASLQVQSLGIFPALGIQPYDLSLFAQVLYFERHPSNKTIESITVDDVIKKIDEYKIL